MSEFVIVFVSLVSLGLGVAIFILPDPRRAMMCFLGLSTAVAGFQLGAGSSVAAWALLLCAGAICLSFLAGKNSSDTGWQNWFVIVVAASTLWLLALFLLWTLEEALVLPVVSPGLAPGPSEVLRLGFDRYGWALTLVGFLVLSTGIVFGRREAE